MQKSPIPFTETGPSICFSRQKFVNYNRESLSINGKNPTKNDSAIAQLASYLADTGLFYFLYGCACKWRDLVGKEKKKE